MRPTSQNPRRARSAQGNRRQWLRSVAAVGAAATLAPALSAASADGEEPEPTPRFRKAVKIGMVQPGKTLLEKFQLLKELGFDGVELNSPGGPGAEEVHRAMEATGLIVHGVVDSVHWRKTLSDPDERIRAEGRQALEQALRDAKAYGATSVLLVPGRVNAEANYEQCWDRSLEQVRRVTPLAAELEIMILLENVWNDFLTDPKETARYIDACESAWVGAYFDVGNTVRYSPPHEWVPILGARIKKLDIKDYGAERRFAHELLEGDVDWPKVIAELKKLDYRGWGTAEVRGGDRERLAEIASRMDRIFSL